MHTPRCIASPPTQPNDTANSNANSCGHCPHGTESGQDPKTQEITPTINIPRTKAAALSGSGDQRRQGTEDFATAGPEHRVEDGVGGAKRLQGSWLPAQNTQRRLQAEPWHPSNALRCRAADTAARRVAAGGAGHIFQAGGGGGLFGRFEGGVRGWGAYTSMV